MLQRSLVRFLLVALNIVAAIRATDVGHKLLVVGCVCVTTIVPTHVGHSFLLLFFIIVTTIGATQLVIVVCRLFLFRVALGLDCASPEGAISAKSGQAHNKCKCRVTRHLGARRVARFCAMVVLAPSTRDDVMGRRGDESHNQSCCCVTRLFVACCAAWFCMILAHAKRTNESPIGTARRLHNNQANCGPRCSLCGPLLRRQWSIRLAS